MLYIITFNEHIAPFVAFTKRALTEKLIDFANTHAADTMMQAASTQEDAIHALVEAGINVQVTAHYIGPDNFAPTPNASQYIHVRSVLRDYCDLIDSDPSNAYLQAQSILPPNLLAELEIQHIFYDQWQDTLAECFIRDHSISKVTYAEGVQTLADFLTSMNLDDKTPLSEMCASVAAQRGLDPKSLQDLVSSAKAPVIKQAVYILYHTLPKN